MQIKFNGNVADIAMILVSAGRYALGRKTYVVEWTCEVISNNIHLLSEQDKKIMIRGIENTKNYGDECDKKCWLELLKKLKNEMKK